MVVDGIDVAQDKEMMDIAGDIAVVAEEKRRRGASRSIWFIV
jgi:hypothetical protein